VKNFEVEFLLSKKVSEVKNIFEKNKKSLSTFSVKLTSFLLVLNQ
jgi:hypothetical protein